MRVLFFGVSGGLGGAERVLLDTVACLRAARPEWTLRVLSVEDGPLRQHVETLGVGYDVLPPPRSFAATGEVGRHPLATALRLALSALPLAPYGIRLRRTMGTWAPDVVHANGLKADVLAAFAAPRRARLVWHVHDYVGSRKVSARLLGACARRVHAVVANSASVAADLEQVLAGRTRVRTVLNAVDTDRFTPGGPIADLDRMAGLLPAAPGTVRVGLVGTYARWKGHDVFLQSLASLGPGTPVRGYVVGGPQYHAGASQFQRADLEGMAARLGLDGRVGFAGFQSDTAPVYRALDIVVHASTAPEPFGLVIAEALSCGRAVIASAAGGALEVGDDTSVVRHDPGDAGQLARRIRALADNPALRARLGAAGRALALARLSRDRFARDVLRVYE